MHVSTALSASLSPLLLLSSLTTTTLAARSDRILLSKVSAITLHADRQTAHRRVPPIPQ
ncbi:MAG: hypothetical protein LQ340_002807, partial [Diploschistes diacapsis]